MHEPGVRKGSDGPTSISSRTLLTADDHPLGARAYLIKVYGHANKGWER